MHGQVKNKNTLHISHYYSVADKMSYLFSAILVSVLRKGASPIIYQCLDWWKLTDICCLTNSKKLTLTDNYKLRDYKVPTSINESVWTILDRKF